MFSRTKIFSLMVAALALALVAGTGFAAAGTVVRQFGTDPTDPSSTGLQLII
jgi:hypothetical protein